MSPETYDQLIQGAWFVASAIFVLLAHALRAWALEHVKDARVKRVTAELDTSAQQVVEFFDQTLVRGLKRAAEDGKITPEELRAELTATKKEAVAKLKVSLSAEAKAYLEKKAQPEEFLDTLLESTIKKTRTEQGES